jgi:transposase InsO family protein
LVTGSGLAVTAVCHVLTVSRSGFYAWQQEREGVRVQRDRELLPLIRDIFWRHKRRYGARRIAQELCSLNERCGVARVARLLKTEGLRAIQPKSFRPRTTESRHRLGYSPNLLAGRAAPVRINEVWVGDITYIPLKGGTFGYLALLMDLYSRRIVGWDYASSMAEPLVLSSLQSAIGGRQPGAGLIHHTDRGGQYAGSKYRGVLRRAGMRQSMSGAGNCYDNAFMESCFGTIKTELELSEYADGVEAVRELSSYVHYYNVERRHSSLGYVSPAAFETEQATRK